MGRPGSFQKGNKIAVGNRGPTRHRFITQQLISLLNECDPKEKKSKVRMLVEKLFECAIEGDSGAIRDIFDRIEGRPVQAVALGRPEDFDVYAEVEKLGDRGERDLAQLYRQAIAATVSAEDASEGTAH